MISLFVFMVSLAAAAVNVAFYVDQGKAISLGAAIFCGGCAAYNLVLAVRS